MPHRAPVTACWVAGPPGTAVARLTWMILRQGGGYLDRTLSAAPFVAVMMTYSSMATPLLRIGAL
jgi:hypothetical protein